jgi:hypothetical protein
MVKESDLYEFYGRCGRGLGDLDRGVTPLYITKKCSRNAGIPPSKLPDNISFFFQRDRFLDHTTGRAGTGQSREGESEEEEEEEREGQGHEGGEPKRKSEQAKAQ